MVETFCLVTLCSNKTNDPILGHMGVIGNRLNNVVLEDEDDGEKDDIGNNDEDNSDASPLKRNDSLDTAIGLARRHGDNTV